jgi:hypothetical protein
MRTVLEALSRNQLERFTTQRSSLSLPQVARQTAVDKDDLTVSL